VKNLEAPEVLQRSALLARGDLPDFVRGPVRPLCVRVDSRSTTFAIFMGDAPNTGPRTLAIQMHMKKLQLRDRAPLKRYRTKRLTASAYDR